MSVAGKPQDATPSYISSIAGSPAGYNHVVASGTAEPLTVVSGAAGVIVVVSGAAARFRADGTPPTASLGWPIANGGTVVLGGDWMNNAEFIAQTGTITLDCSYFG